MTLTFNCLKFLIVPEKLSAKMGHVNLSKKGGVKMASFRKRGSTWQYRIKHKDPLTHEQIEVSKGGFKTKKKHN